MVQDVVIPFYKGVSKDVLFTVPAISIMWEYSLVVGGQEFEVQ